MVPHTQIDLRFWNAKRWNSSQSVHTCAWSPAALVVANTPLRAENGLLSERGERHTHQCSRKVHFHVVHTIDCLYRLVQYTTSCKGSLKISSQVPGTRNVTSGRVGAATHPAVPLWHRRLPGEVDRYACPAGAWEARGPRHGPCSSENRLADLDRSLHCGSNHRERSVFSFWSKQFWLAFAMGNWTILRSLKEINPFIVGWTL